jgi:hypothetical protein
MMLHVSTRPPFQVVALDDIDEVPVLEGVLRVLPGLPLT